MTTWIAIGLWACGAVASPADPGVTVSTRLSPPEIPFHRQARFSIIVEAPEDVPVVLPEMVDSMGGAPVADVHRDTVKLKDKRVRITETYAIDPIFAGNYAIKPVQVKWGDNEALVVASPALRVRDLTEDEKTQAAEFAPNAGAATIPGVLAEHWEWLAVAVLAVALLLGVPAWVVWRRKRIEIATPPLPAWEVAYRRLRELDERQLPQAGKHEPYYVDLSAILRYYIEDRFYLHAPEQTTPEFLAASSKAGQFSIGHQQQLAEFLKHSDRVKFAQYVPTVPEMEHSFTMVLQFVDETVPKPASDAQPEAEVAA